MPVFTAFGWAGEETAIKYALSQLELFAQELHRGLPRSIQEKFPYHGLSNENQSVYLAASETVGEDVYISFFARPMSLELQLTITNEAVLNKIYRQAEKEPVLCHRLLTEPGPEWSLRVQQMQIDEDSGETTHYQDLFKDSVAALDEATSVAVMSKAAYLNADDRWLVPFYFSRRFDSERVAAMGMAITQVMGEQVALLMPIVDFLTGKTARKKSKPKGRARTAVETAVEIDETEPDSAEMFSYVAELKPLHLRQGF
ncbi:MAG: hypothetical protein KC441_07965, partial [Anaerolineales bacterium]|nr:hypothetical protein [Anaerolineales bacterium]